MLRLKSNLLLYFYCNRITSNMLLSNTAKYRIWTMWYFVQWLHQVLSSCGLPFWHIIFLLVIVTTLAFGFFSPSSIACHIFCNQTLDAAKAIAVSIVGNRFDYCNSILYGMSQANIDRLQHVQNVLALVIAKSLWTNIRRDLHWLPVNHCITYKLCLITWKTLHTTQPPYLSELIAHYLPSRSLRSSNTNLLTRFYGITSNFSSRVFSVSASSTWNSLPEHIRRIDKLSTFKHQLKSHLFQSVFPSSHPVCQRLRYRTFYGFWRFINMRMYVCIVCMFHRHSVR